MTNDAKRLIDARINEAPKDQVKSAFTKLMIVAIKEMDNRVITDDQVEEIQKALKKILKV